jgi:aspartate dehydrogenase
MADLNIGVAGLGAVGGTVARRLHEGVKGLTLAAFSARDREKARRILPGFDGPCLPPEALHEVSDVVVECLPPPLFRTIAEPTLRAGKVFMPLSVGQLLEHWDLVEIAERCGGRILAPTGALLGLDAVRAAAEGEICSVAIVTRKPPRGLAGAPYLVQHGISLDGLDEPLCVYSGPVREAASGFPANLNVAVALSLAGVGPDRTRLEVWADPTIERNTHSITVDADSARFTMTIEGVPSEENPRTGKITALSTIAALKALVAPLKVGS